MKPMKQQALVDSILYDFLGHIISYVIAQEIIKIFYSDILIQNHYLKKYCMDAFNASFQLCPFKWI